MTHQGAKEYDWAAIAEKVADVFFGKPNKQLSKPHELRYGNNGSLKIVIRGPNAGTFSDFERGASGGMIDLIEYALQGNREQALAWLEESFGKPGESGGQPERIASVYDYQDETGAVLFQVVRKEPKRFLQRRSEDDWSVKGIRVVPYNLPRVRAAIEAQEPVFVVEGEKDVENLVKLGLTATCNAGGAGKWKREHAECLRDADVIVIPDNDQAGEDHAESVAQSLAGKATRIRILRLIGLERKGDVSDWLEAGNAVTALIDLASEAPDWRAASRIALTWLGEEDRIPPRNWLVKGILGENELSVIYAPSGGGKSFFALDLSARVAANMDWFGHKVRGCPTMYVAAEGSRGFRMRMKAWRQHHHPESVGAPFVMFASSVDLLDPKSNGIDIVQDAMQEIHDHTGESVRLIVLDTLSRMMPGGVDSEPRDVKLFLENTERLRTESGAHVMIVHHSGKETERGMRGSSMLRDFADTVIEIKGSETDGPLQAIIQKQKDGQDGQSYRFNLLQSTVGEDEDGDPITSCVVDPIGASEGNDTARRPRLNDREEIARRCLAELLADQSVTSVTTVTGGIVTRTVTLEQWRDEVRDKLAVDNDVTFRKVWERLKNKLLRLAIIGIHGGQVWLA